MQALYQSTLDLLSRLFIPDWGALVNLLPVFIAILIVLWFGWTAMRFATIGPARRGRQRVTPVPPPGVHMPGGSLAPFLGAFGVFLTLGALVAGGPFIIIGLAALALALLYWLREGLRDYDRLVRAESLPAVVRQPPPPGIHVPAPSFRPLLGALALGLVFFGLVFGPWILAAGVIVLIAALLGWLRDARLEYSKAVEADRTGHLEPLLAPGYPTRLFGFIVVIAVFATLIQAGIVPPKSTLNAGAGAAAASGAPGGGGGAGAGGPAGGSGGPGGPAADVHVTAKDIAFDTHSLTGPGGRPFTIALVNNDAGVPHNVSIKDSSGKVIYQGDSFTGVATKVENVPSIPAGTYTFICTVHPFPAMTGTITLK
jgi:plastocyanin